MPSSIYSVHNKLAKRFPNFVLADGCHLPFRNNSFDRVYRQAVIEHVGDPVAFLKELIRVSKETVTIKVPHQYWRPQDRSHIISLVSIGFAKC
ncbi:MAG: class I SAM-dependent methyltransferase [Candidatus Aminicenantes bacterium]|nr:MAG: class I SAM-dependent methyltransferase [Candidatus Aminicenantes bacterium]